MYTRCNIAHSITSIEMFKNLNHSLSNTIIFTDSNPNPAENKENNVFAFNFSTFYGFDWYEKLKKKKDYFLIII